MAAESDREGRDNGYPSTPSHPHSSPRVAPAYLPLRPDVQQKLKALIHQLTLALQRHQLDADVQAQLHQLALVLAPYTQPGLMLEQVKAALASEHLSSQDRQAFAEGLVRLHRDLDAHQRLNHLAKQIEQYLNANTVPAAVQAELARLLSLMSSIRDYPHYISELELAVAALLPGVLTAPHPGTPPTPDTTAKGLNLARRIRHHLRLVTRQQPFPLGSLLSASGAGQNRLFSGLSWFLLIFSLLPALAYGGIMVLGVGRIQDLTDELETTNATLERVRMERRSARRRASFYESNIGSLETRLDRVANRHNRLLADAEDPPTGTSTWLGYQREVTTGLQDKLSNEFTPVRNALGAAAFNPEDENFSLLTDELANLEDYSELAQLLTTLDQISQSQPPDVTLDEPLPSDEPLTWALQLALLGQIEAEVRGQRTPIQEGQTLARAAFDDDPNGEEAPLASGEDPDMGADDIQATQANTAASANSTPESANNGEAATGDEITETGDNVWDVLMAGLLETANQVDLPLVLAVVSAGALGGFVSVIVRAGDLVQSAEEKHLDLFFVGFFRPVVGMTFAFFLVAVIESGILSGIFSLGHRDNSEDRDRIYLYIAISFVAGFSERLVRDFVVKTERQFSGFSTDKSEFETDD